MLDNFGVYRLAHLDRESLIYSLLLTIIFCQATPEQCSHLEHLLTIYEQASGQLLNKEKTALFFSRNTPRDTQKEIKFRFEAEVIKQHETYLA